MTSEVPSTGYGLRRLPACLLLMFLVAGACGGSEDADALGDVTTTSVTSPVVATTASSSIPSVTETDAPAAADGPEPTTPVGLTNPPATEATVLADRFAVTDPVEVSIEWTCDGELIDRGAGILISQCTSGQIEPWFARANWFVSVRLIRDDDGVVIAVSSAASGYSGDCMWNRALDSTFDEGPVIDGKASSEGILFGDGHCAGLQFRYENTFDIDEHTNVTSGVIELIP